MIWKDELPKEFHNSNSSGEVFIWIQWGGFMWYRGSRFVTDLQLTWWSDYVNDSVTMKLLTNDLVKEGED
jgi:hypothetical protein